MLCILPTALHRLLCATLAREGLLAPIAQDQGNGSRVTVLNRCDHHPAHLKYAPVYTSSSRAEQALSLLHETARSFPIVPYSFFASAGMSNSTQPRSSPNLTSVASGAAPSGFKRIATVIPSPLQPLTFHDPRLVGIRVPIALRQVFEVAITSKKE